MTQNCHPGGCSSGAFPTGSSLLRETPGSQLPHISRTHLFAAWKVPRAEKALREERNTGGANTLLTSHRRTKGQWAGGTGPWWLLHSLKTGRDFRDVLVSKTNQDVPIQSLSHPRLPGLNFSDLWMLVGSIVTPSSDKIETTPCLPHSWPIYKKVHSRPHLWRKEPCVAFFALVARFCTLWHSLGPCWLSLHGHMT